MIRVNKPSRSPSVLLKRGVTKRDEHCREYLAHPTNYQNGQSKFTFTNTIYGHKSVKNALIRAQHKKCCFCECKVGNDGDVEHFRPKAGSCQASPKNMLRPGYYWLAYDWDNLFLCCSACNSRHKKNLFPLENPNDRARSHNDDIDNEQPLFINPGEEDPELFISFRKEIPYAIKGNVRGKKTIEALGLNREIMNELRRHELNMLCAMQDIVDQEFTQTQTDKWKRLVAYAKKYLENSIKDDAVFASMARNFRREDCSGPSPSTANLP